VFGPARVAVDVRGCFWHGCEQHGTWPRTNADWWKDKITRNRDRDRDTVERLESARWLVVVVWEHEDPAMAAENIYSIVRSRRHELER
jgi:DNA mismatch endonuclease (patch repair protein)